jgi:hypothetical protein
VKGRGGSMGREEQIEQQDEDVAGYERGRDEEDLKTTDSKNGRSEYITDGIAAKQIGYGSNKKTRHMMPSGHKAFLVHNVHDMDMLLMHNQTYAAEYVFLEPTTTNPTKLIQPAESPTPCQQERESRSSPRLRPSVSRSPTQRPRLQLSHRCAVHDDEVRR